MSVGPMNYISQNESSIITQFSWIRFQYSQTPDERKLLAIDVSTRKWMNIASYRVESINEVLPSFSTFAYKMFVQTSNVREKELENDVSVRNQVSSIKS